MFDTRLEVFFNVLIVPPMYHLTSYVTDSHISITYFGSLSFVCTSPHLTEYWYVSVLYDLKNIPADLFW